MAEDIDKQERVKWKIDFYFQSGAQKSDAKMLEIEAEDAEEALSIAQEITAQDEIVFPATSGKMAQVFRTAYLLHYNLAPAVLRVGEAAKKDAHAYSVANRMKSRKRPNGY